MLVFPKITLEAMVTEAIDALDKNAKKSQEIAEGLAPIVDGNYIVMMGEEACSALASTIDSIIDLIMEGAPELFSYYYYECINNDRAGKITHQDGNTFEFRTVPEFIDYVYGNLKPKDLT